MTDTQIAGILVTDGFSHTLTVEHLDPLAALLKAMAGNNDIHAFQYAHGAHPGRPATGYRLAAGSFEATRYHDDLIVAGQDPHIVETNPESRAYWDNFRVGSGWTYKVNLGHSVALMRESDRLEVVYVFVKPANNVEPVV